MFRDYIYQLSTKRKDMPYRKEKVNIFEDAANLKFSLEFFTKCKVFSSAFNSPVAIT